MEAGQALVPTRPKVSGLQRLFNSAASCSPESSESSEICVCACFLLPISSVSPGRGWGAQDATLWGGDALWWPWVSGWKIFKPE